MKLRVKNHDPHLSSDKKPVVVFELPDDKWDHDAVLWAIAYYEVQSAIEGRFRTYTSSLYRHIRVIVSPTISGGFIKMVIKDLADKGIIKINSRDEIVWIDPNWRDVLR